MTGHSDNRTEIREFLVTRRAKLGPAQVGLPATGRRRVPGLRREEVAVLAGVSTDWYTRLEKGHITGVSTEVLDAVATALRLDDTEREHLHNLARTARPAAAARRRPRPQVPANMQRVLDSMTGTAAFVRNGCLDVLASNALGRALYAPLFDDPANGENLARFAFLDPRAATFYAAFEDALDVTVALMRTEAGRGPHDKGLTDLVGQLATVSDEFRIRWGAHDVRRHAGGDKVFCHPVVGPLHLTWDSLDLVGAPGLVLTAYTAEPGTTSADGLALLATWAATEGLDAPAGAAAARRSQP